LVRKGVVAGPEQRPHEARLLDREVRVVVGEQLRYEVVEARLVRRVDLLHHAAWPRGATSDSEPVDATDLRKVEPFDPNCSIAPNRARSRQRTRAVPSNHPILPSRAISTARRATRASGIAASHGLATGLSAIRRAQKRRRLIARTTP